MMYFVTPSWYLNQVLSGMAWDALSELRLGKGHLANMTSGMDKIMSANMQFEKIFFSHEHAQTALGSPSFSYACDPGVDFLIHARFVSYHHPSHPSIPCSDFSSLALFTPCTPCLNATQNATMRKCSFATRHLLRCVRVWQPHHHFLIRTRDEVVPWIIRHNLCRFGTWQLNRGI